MFNNFQKPLMLRGNYYQAIDNILQVLIVEFHSIPALQTSPLPPSTETSETRRPKIITWWEIGIVVFAMMGICLCVTIFDRIGSKHRESKRSTARDLSSRRDIPSILISKEDERVRENEEDRNKLDAKLKKQQQRKLSANILLIF